MLDNPVSFSAMGYGWWYDVNSYKRVLSNIEFIVERKRNRNGSYYYILDVQEAALEGENQYPTHITTFPLDAETNREFYTNVVEQLKKEGLSCYQLVESDFRKRFIDELLDEL